MDVRVGIVGAGWIAEQHVATLRKLANVEIVGVCDIDQGRAKALAGSAPTYGAWRDLISGAKPEVLLVCTPPLTHREVAVPALQQGIHVYLEKPIARGLEDAKAIVEAASRSKAVCAVGYQWRAVEVLDDLRKALEGQEIGLQIAVSVGPTKSRPWFVNKAQGGGNLLERASHSIDLERAVGGEVVSVQAVASNVMLAQSEVRHGDIEDAVVLTLRFAGGGIGSIQVAWTREGITGTYSLDVLGTHAYLRLALDPDFALHGESGGRPIEAKSRQHPLERSMARFLEAARIGDRTRVFCTPADAAGTLATAVACEEALVSGGTVAVPRIR
ncbi:MAG: Gfo/Idh/MocA family oxidoreductase [Candidatus Dormibacteraeota bacterium]|nr:Gfo/Idh/MocA family oxidoreductase [Candidatus Dormibacteraeota bacterium]